MIYSAVHWLMQSIQTYSGDALGIYPTNHPAEVSMLLKAMHCTGEEQIEKPSWAYTCTEDKNIYGK